jgi:BCD family chlorophyll transporter-like MFS transporter
MKRNFLENLRLAGFPLGLGLTSVLVGGTLNRVMIVELGIPASLVGLFFALPLIISPLRVWLGYRSDAYPLWGLRREPFIILGSLMAGIGVLGATMLILNRATLGILTGLAVAAAFLAYGLGKNLSSNTFEALLADKFHGDARPRAVTFFKVAMFLGIMIGAVLLGRLLDPFSTSRLAVVVIGVAGLSFLLAVLGVIFQEPRRVEVEAEIETAKKVPFMKTFKTMVWADRQIRRFFIFVMLTVVGTLGQDVLLEPYAALALGMSVGETSALTAIWGAGTLLSMAAAGGWLIKKFGYVKVVRFGLVLGIVIFTGLILTGFFGLSTLFLVLVFLLGVSTGLSASGMLTAVIEFTTSARAGLLMGVWGVAHNLGQALGSLLSGATVDLVRAFDGNAMTAYGVVFALEGFLLLLAMGLLNRISFRESRILSEGLQQEA